MNDQKHIIVINGRRYNAKTGENLSHPVSHEPAAPPHKAAAAKPARHPAKHVAAHQPKHTRTLMRQSVHKPQPSLKRTIRVQGHLASQVEPVHTETPARVLHGRHTGAKPHIQHDRIIISHFSPDLFSVVKHVPMTEDGPAQHSAPMPNPTMKPAFAPAPKTASKPISKATHKKPLTTAELLEYVVLNANAPSEEEHPARAHHKPHRKLLKRHSHAAATH